MLYYLGIFLESNGLGVARLLGYVSFRAILAFVLALLFATWAGGYIIKFLHRKSIGETIRQLGLEGQQRKHNTPTMGGIIIIAAILVPTLLFCRLDNVYIILMVVTTLMMGTIEGGRRG